MKRTQMRKGVTMSHVFRLASLISACVIPLASGIAADPLSLDQRFQRELDTRLEAKLNGLLNAKLQAQAASLLGRERTGADGLAETKLGEVVQSGWIAPSGTPAAGSSTACSGTTPKNGVGPARPAIPASISASWAAPVS